MRYEEVFGGLAQQKIFVETQKMRPPALPDSVRRTVKTCTVMTAAANPVEVTGGGGNKFYEARQEICMFPPDTYLAAVGFPEHWNWCKADDLLEPIKSFFTCPTDFRSVGCAGYTPSLSWFDPNDDRKSNAGKVVDPERFYSDYVYDVMFPGYLCAWKDQIPGAAGDCTWYKPNDRVYKYCGVSQDGSSKWDAYDTNPTGTSVAYFHGYQVRRACARPPCIQRRARVLLPLVLTLLAFGVGPVLTLLALASRHVSR